MSVEMVLRRSVHATRQGGAALIVFATIVVLIVATALLSRLNAGAVRREFDDQTTRVLALAKDALIAFAVTYPDYYPAGAPNTSEGPGRLPCPDTNNDGLADPPCGGAGLIPQVRRLPWRELGLPDLRDGSGERLWYAVSGNHKNNTSTVPLNSETAGNLSVDSTLGLVAVVIAPGIALDGQANRPSELLTDYLEGTNADGDGAFASGPASGTFNDRVIFVSRDELMRAVERRVLGALTLALQRYRLDHVGGAYPSGYFPALRPLNPVVGTATAGTVSGTLYDTTKGSPGFAALGVVAGDVLYSVTNNTHAVVSTVNNDSLVTAGPLALAVGDAYEVRGIAGRFPQVLDTMAGNDVPDWFFSNRWDDLTYVALAATEAEGGGGVGCVPGASCLTLLGSQSVVNDKTAIVLAAGAGLTGQTRPATGVSEYLEGDNANGDLVYTRGVPTATFNDQAFGVGP